MGNVWEWVEDHFNGMPGFETNMYYDDFSTPCFDGKHNLIKVLYVLFVMVFYFLTGTDFV